MKKKIVSVMLCAAMATTVLAGCGSSNTASTDAAAEETTEDAEAAEEATDAAEVTTVEPGVLTMGTNATFPPYEYKDGDAVVGIDPDIAQALADKLGLKLEVVDMEFDSLIASVQSGKVDIVLAGMTVNEERKKNVDFTDPYANGVQVIIVADGSDIATFDGLKILDTQYANEDYAAAVSKKNPELTEALNKALQELKDDGTVQEILDKYIKAE